MARTIAPLARLKLAGIVAAAMLYGCNDNPVAELDRAKAYVAKSEPAKAVIHLKSAVAGDPNNGEIRLL